MEKQKSCSFIVGLDMAKCDRLQDHIQTVVAGGDHLCENGGGDIISCDKKRP